MHALFFFFLSHIIEIWNQSSFSRVQKSQYMLKEELFDKVNKGRQSLQTEFG